MESFESFSTRTGLVPLSVPTPFIVGPVNVFLWKQDPLTLIDTGVCTPDAEAALHEHLQAQGITVKDIRRVFLTHHHLDHSGLARRIQDASGAEVWGHPDLPLQSQLNHAHDESQRQFFVDILHEFGVAPEMAEQTMLLWDIFRSLAEDFTVDRFYTDGGEAGPFRTWFVPGHSATDVLFQHETGRYTIVADHLLETFNPNPLIRRPSPGQPRPKSLVEYQASLMRSRALDLGRCFPGHGPFFDDHRAVADGLFGTHTKRNRRILAGIPEDGATVYNVTRELYPELQPRHLYLGLSVAVGQLEVLEAAGAVRAEHRGGVLHYSRIA